MCRADVTNKTVNGFEKYIDRTHFEWETSRRNCSSRYVYCDQSAERSHLHMVLFLEGTIAIRLIFIYVLIIFIRFWKQTGFIYKQAMWDYLDWMWFISGRKWSQSQAFKWMNDVENSTTASKQTTWLHCHSTDSPLESHLLTPPNHREFECSPKTTSNTN